MSKNVILSEAKDLAREWFDPGGEDPSVAALPQDDTRLLIALYRSSEWPNKRISTPPPGATPAKAPPAASAAKARYPASSTATVARPRHSPWKPRRSTRC